jgi:hypothetical protein
MEKFLNKNLSVTSHFARLKATVTCVQCLAVPRLAIIYCAEHNIPKTFGVEHFTLAPCVRNTVNIFPIKNGNRLLSQQIFCMGRFRYACLEKYLIKLLGYHRILNSFA